MEMSRARMHICTKLLNQKPCIVYKIQFIVRPKTKHRKADDWFFAAFASKFKSKSSSKHFHRIRSNHRGQKHSEFIAPTIPLTPRWWPQLATSALQRNWRLQWANLSNGTGMQAGSFCPSEHFISLGNLSCSPHFPSLLHPHPHFLFSMV